MPNNNFNEVNSKFEEQKCSNQDVNKNSFSLFNQTNLRYDGGNYNY